MLGSFDFTERWPLGGDVVQQPIEFSVLSLLHGSVLIDGLAQQILQINESFG
jgi:hypothetical protein